MYALGEATNELPPTFCTRIFCLYLQKTGKKANFRAISVSTTRFICEEDRQHSHGKNKATGTAALLVGMMTGRSPAMRRRVVHGLGIHIPHILPASFRTCYQYKHANPLGRAYGDTQPMAVPCTSLPIQRTEHRQDLESGLYIAIQPVGFGAVVVLITTCIPVGCMYLWKWNGASVRPAPAGARSTGSGFRGGSWLGQWGEGERAYQVGFRVSPRLG